MNALIKEIFADGKEILKGSGRRIKRHGLLIFALLALVFGIAFALFPHDMGLYHRITDHRPENLVRLSNLFRRWGDFRDVLIFTLLIFVSGWITKKRTWRTAAIGCLLAACMAGLTVNVIRLSTGRPRPYVDKCDGFYGPTTQYKMRSFPSGNATTSSAFASALLVTLPYAGIPALLSAVGVTVASVYSCTHHVSDVIAGAGIGIIAGILVGWATRQRMRKRPG